MKAGWRTVQLGEICTFNYGKALPESARNGGDTPVFGSNGVVGSHDSSITNGRTIVIGRKGSFGEVNFSAVPSWPIDTAYFVDETSTDQDIRWLYYRLGSLGLNQMNKAAAVPGLNRDDAYRTELLLPPLPEQRRIAAILDKADALRTKRREALAQLDRLAQSIFVEMFGDPATNPKGWPVVQLGEHLLDVTNGLTRRGTEVDEGEHIVLRLRDIRAGSIDFSEPNRITLNEKEQAKYRVAPGELLFIRVNGNPEYVGRCSLFDGYFEEVFFNDHVMRVRLKNGLEGGYLAFFLNRPDGKREIAKHRKTSAGQHTINQDGLGAISLPVPPLELQQVFLHRLAALRKSSTSHFVALAELDALFGSIQHRAFRGEL